MPMSTTSSRIVSSAAVVTTRRANGISGIRSTIGCRQLWWCSGSGPHHQFPLRHQNNGGHASYHDLLFPTNQSARPLLSSTKSMTMISGFPSRRCFRTFSCSGSLLRNQRNLVSAIMLSGRNSKTGTFGSFDTTSKMLQHQQNRGLIGGGGGYSRMLDMGGAPSALHDKSSTHKLNLSKNCHLQAVIFDFDILTRSVKQAVGNDNHSASKMQTTTTTPKLPGIVHSHAIEPDRGIIEEVAGLLNVDLSGSKTEKPRADQSFEDDLSLLLTGEKSNPTKKEAPKQPSATTTTSSTTVPTSDIRAKYAAKLKSAGFQAGLSGVDRAKEETTMGGDAAGHWAARAHATTSPSSAAGSRWMAATGTGKLLQYLYQRSMKLALVGTPVPAVTNTPNNEETKQMNDFLQQMKDKVVFASVIPQDGTLTVDRLAQRAIQEVLSKPSSNGTTTTTSTAAAAASARQTDLSPDRCVWVSDRDDCLRAAREAGLVTVRIRPPNARRGQVSAHYTVETVPDTQQVINEINGISFKTVLQQGV